MYCPNCAEDCPTKIEEREETYPVKREDTTITAKIRVCKICGSEIFDERLDSQNIVNAFAKYREKHGLLSPDEIRLIRDKQGLNQEEFANLLQFTQKRMKQIENGTLQTEEENRKILKFA